MKRFILRYLMFKKRGKFLVGTKAYKRDQMDCVAITYNSKLCTYTFQHHKSIYTISV